MRGPREVSILGGSTACTAVAQRNATPCSLASHAASLGIASRDSTRSSCGLQSTASSADVCNSGHRSRAAIGVSSRQPSAISERKKASSTAADSGRCAASHRPRCTTGIPAWAATSCGIRARAARPGARSSAVDRPVTVMRPKLRTEAPHARTSRSMTTTFSLRRAAARAQDSPMMPAPTTTRSIRSMRRSPEYYRPRYWVRISFRLTAARRACTTPSDLK